MKRKISGSRRWQEREERLKSPEHSGAAWAAGRGKNDRLEADFIKEL